MLNHKGTKKLTTERLLLRKLRESDAYDYFTQIVNDKTVLKYTAWPYHESIEQTEEMLANWENAYTKPVLYNWGVEFEGRIIGNITVYRIYEDTNTMELGYCFGKDFWNRGFATEAAKAVIDFLLNQVNAETVIISFAAANPASGKVGEKCGMTYVQTYPKAFTTMDGEVVDILEYKITRN